MNNKEQRILAIDILRGLDLFLLLFLQPVLVAVSCVYKATWYQSIMWQLDHEVWEGFRVWDLVMPLFLFMVGVSMPFSFQKYNDCKNTKSALYKKVIRRFLILFVLGMIVQGNLLGFSKESLKIYNNTLQAIGVGYLLASFIIINFRFKYRVVWAIMLLIIYSIPMAIVGDYAPERSFAFMVDEIIIGSFRGDLSYTWIWSSLTFTVTVLMGSFAGQILQSKKIQQMQKFYCLITAGLVLVLGGWILGEWEPIIKRLWTSTMTMFAGGWCFILMGLTYSVVDIAGINKGFGWLKIYGMNAITSYCVGEVINFRSVVHSLTYGLQHLLDQWYDVILVFGNYLVLFIILKIMYDHKIFLKV